MCSQTVILICVVDWHYLWLGGILKKEKKKKVKECQEHLNALV
jgi:hypothetical protein